MAQPDQSGDWASRLSPSLDEVKSLARDAFAHLPDNFRALCCDIKLQIEDFPDEQIIEDMGLESPFDLLGLFEGEGIGERFSIEKNLNGHKLSLYRRPLLDYWAENEESLGEIITHVLIHEIGQHFGLSDEDMEALEVATQ